MNNENIALLGVNVGRRITEKLEDLGMSKAELSRALNMNQSNLNKLLKKYSLETDKLVEISKAVKYNFFKDFCRSNSYIEEYLRDEEFFITEANIGALIGKRIKELGLTQKQVAEEVAKAVKTFRDMINPKLVINSEMVFRQQYVSTITKRTSVDTELLYFISYALNFNFFECFYKKSNSTESQGQKKDVPWEVVRKVDAVLIENGNLKYQVNMLRDIIQTIGITDDELKKLGFNEWELRIADIHGDRYEVHHDDAVWDIFKG